MHVIRASNVREAWYYGIGHLLAEGRRETSRAGDVLVAPTPVTTVYQNPTQRVLIDPQRDANPFFHTIEALWMLAGRQDAALLDRYVGDFGERFAEPDGRVHGAYGYRWRNEFGFDQLSIIIDKLKENYLDRQCVLQMWDCTPYRIDGCDDLGGDWRDRPCNTHCYFRGHVDGSLDLTVCCRSNDMVFGGYGANAVHFSMLLEYTAAMSGLRIGLMYQVSNNFHAYIAVLEKCCGMAVPTSVSSYREETQPLVDDPKTFDEEIRVLLKYTDHDELSEMTNHNFSNKFLSRTVVPMILAHRLWRNRVTNCLDAAASIKAEDWRRATTEWLQRRMR